MKYNISPKDYQTQFKILELYTALLRTAFTARNRLKDPVTHFYETFLAEYDPQRRVDRGVYYTPPQVIAYIVRSD